MKRVVRNRKRESESPQVHPGPGPGPGGGGPQCRVDLVRRGLPGLHYLPVIEGATRDPRAIWPLFSLRKNPSFVLLPRYQWIQFWFIRLLHVSPPPGGSRALDLWEDPSPPIMLPAGTSNLILNKPWTILNKVFRAAPATFARVSY